jgi:HPt (histidine-containing phosphotransfer) domain-containing protein
MAALRQQFVVRCADRIEVLQDALSRDDRATIASTAHALAGTAGIFSFSELSRSARLLEEAAESPTSDCEALKALAGDLVEQLKTIAGVKD